MNSNAKGILNTKIFKLFSIAVLFIFFSNLIFSYAIEYSGFGGKPAFPREDNPRTESIFIHTVNPGETVKEGVRVINNTGETKTFLVYAADYTRSTDGGFACRQYSQEKKGLGNWITLETEELTVDSMSEETILFNINVPEDVEIGEHNGCIIIQEKKPPSEEAGISISVRTGLRVAVTIPGEIIRKLSLSDLLVKRKGLNTLTLSLSIKNTGNVSVDTDVKVRVTNLFKKEIITFGGKYPIFRNDEATYNYDIKSPTFGSIYKAKGVITYDGNSEIFIGKTDYVNPITIETRPVYFLVFPTLKGITIICGSIFVLIFLFIKSLIRRKRKNWIMKNWVQYKARKNEDINYLSDKFNVNWKLLAKTNKLKAPYIIKSGDILKVPPKNPGDLKSVEKQTKESKIVKKTIKDNPKNKQLEKTKTKSKTKPKNKSTTKTKITVKPRTTVEKKIETEPPVDEISSIV